MKTFFYITGCVMGFVGGVGLFLASLYMRWDVATYMTTIAILGGQIADRHSTDD